jgi:hypothetical protein
MGIDVLIGRALDKRDAIIKREGDDDGERLKPYYLRQLVEEEIKADMMKQRCSCEVVI